MRAFLFGLCALLLLPSAALAQSDEYTYNSYTRDIKKQTDAGWEELQAADASATHEERCRHASAAVYSYNQAAQTSATLAQVLSYRGGEYYDSTVELRDAARDIAQQVEDMYNEQCG
ncbi:hypothetical protein ABAC460_00595 [Asticcacaulis sp. AC460]|uniref:hypothetical protein n=1 Tax=Asticcacaulis sp. AC460 TaxID=1282360 RepID=UPI0003C40502|nr:hypothetical protein [Asticcacaulis sp. AC460]ESQ93600.1 hypothetical protein ABAC460_00595 [Asticcacaulis sp. AC460]